MLGLLKCSLDRYEMGRRKEGRAHRRIRLCTAGKAGLLRGDLSRPRRSRWGRAGGQCLRGRGPQLPDSQRRAEGRGCQLNCCLCEGAAWRGTWPTESRHLPAHFWECPVSLHFGVTLLARDPVSEALGPVHLSTVKARG